MEAFCISTLLKLVTVTVHTLKYEKISMMWQWFGLLCLSREMLNPKKDFFFPYQYFLKFILDIGATQVKWHLWISSIFDAMNFQHFLEMLEIM